MGNAMVLGPVFKSSERDRRHSNDHRSHREICGYMCCEDHRRSVLGTAVRLGRTVFPGELLSRNGRGEKRT